MRQGIIRVLFESLKQVLESADVYQYGVVLKDPKATELGTLAHLLKTSQMRVADVNIKNRIFFLQECRNKIAHMDCCNPAEVKELFHMADEVDSKA